MTKSHKVHSQAKISGTSKVLKSSAVSEATNQATQNKLVYDYFGIASVIPSNISEECRNSYLTLERRIRKQIPICGPGACTPTRDGWYHRCSMMIADILSVPPSNNVTAVVHKNYDMSNSEHPVTKHWQTVTSRRFSNSEESTPVTIIMSPRGGKPFMIMTELVNSAIESLRQRTEQRVHMCVHSPLSAQLRSLTQVGEVHKAWELYSRRVVGAALSVYDDLIATGSLPEGSLNIQQHACWEKRQSLNSTRLEPFEGEKLGYCHCGMFTDN
ncbi:hypothetical protein TREMEDRAFT_63284 [Tremella mesenterica DSM 1558]|uniref:uncharacterized protein n=1 Tax=Tremella mesenterica (strain ATCC 24925 / CBS 8224 / DSM 1558 / NBRC 9311 / NRRL Y-6157 / RJB 2259-6 / UBC 559-6) TaxID=578456 RepID=UPI0003F49D4A|nr:uncharacterized protein TREMEDRAFT_63284 [Tremella mesenterica DSM 1558]EIW68820.1 hypothetical protein TREMEDRAFT_63284 [Tremella mesenterica DSM 1558]